MKTYETKVINQIQDFTHLNWTLARRSSGSAGSFLKAFTIKNNTKYYYKLSAYDVVNGIVGHECINEIIADRLLTAMDIPHLSYHLIHGNVLIRGMEYTTYFCESMDFKSPGDSKIALDAYYEMEALPKESPLDFCVRNSWGEYIYNMLIFDYLILNRDRHGANIEILKNTKRKNIEPAPLFDHGLSMYFSCYNDSDLSKEDPLKDKKVQCFIGSSSTYENLRLIPKEYLIRLPAFNEDLKEYLFYDLTESVSDLWIESIWNFLKLRAKQYEDFCNHK